MRVSTEEKDRSRERILAAAGRLFRQHGVQGASVGDIMREAGMTHGGFYRHFADKDALLAAALTGAFETFAKELEKGAEDNASAAVDEFRSQYLSAHHLATPSDGCPAAALGPDIARATGQVRIAFTEGVNKLVENFALGRVTEHNPRKAALRDLAMMVGALVLARASEKDFASEILRACASAVDSQPGSACISPSPVDS